MALSNVSFHLMTPIESCDGSRPNSCFDKLAGFLPNSGVIERSESGVGQEKLSLGVSSPLSDRAVAGSTTGRKKQRQSAFHPARDEAPFVAMRVGNEDCSLSIGIYTSGAAHGA
jgi:hypothetical protein